MLQDKPTKIVIEHKDRLTRFGFEYIKILCESFNCEIVIINNNNDNLQTDLMTDFVSIITSMTAKLYGLRKSHRKTEKIIEELNKDD
jgi:predicted site-specific integrase-resolvase